MKKSILKWLGLTLVGLLVGLYTAFVAECFWNWFAVPALHVSNISFLEMLGLLWLIRLLTSTDKDNEKWYLLASSVELCVPPEKEAELSKLKEGSEHRPIEIGLPFGWHLGVRSAVNTALRVCTLNFAQVAGNTLALVLGLALHVLIS